MIRQYIIISLRNIRKYKAQTVISICAMAVSVVLMAVIASFVLFMSMPPMFSGQHLDRLVQVVGKNQYDYISPEDLNLMLGHQFKSVDSIEYLSVARYTVSATVNNGKSDERTLVSTSVECSGSYLNAGGLESALSGEKVAVFNDNEVVITEWLARQLYRGENPIGLPISLFFYNYDGSELEKTFVVKDVIEPSDESILKSIHVFFSDSHIPTDTPFQVYMFLRNGFSDSDVAKELGGISDGRLTTVNLVDKIKESTAEKMLLRNSVIFFLFLFVCVSFTSYLRQECQLFRLRERELAIHTCCGCKPGNLFTLLFTEILTVLLVTFVLTMILNSLAVAVVDRYFSVLTEFLWIPSDTMKIEAITTLVLIAITAVVVAISIRNIRRDQTGLAMRFKPAPKHRLRNIGITLQMTISLFFISMVFLLIPTKNLFMQGLGIPTDIDNYKKQLLVDMNAVTKAQEAEVYDMVERLESIDRIFRFSFHMSMILNVGDNDEYHTYVIYRQRGNDLIDLYRLETKDLPSYNPERNILVSEEFMNFLKSRGEWNGRSVSIDGQDYELRGTFTELPFGAIMSMKSVIITDNGIDDNSSSFRVILPKENKEKEARENIAGVLRQVLPSRIDVGTRLFFSDVDAKYQLLMAMYVIINILMVVSIVTSVATIYASVSLDTRRRRKEMAIRKINGATSKVIRRIFLRNYIIILGVAALIAFPAILLLSQSSPLSVNDIVINPVYVVISFLCALLMAALIAGITIYWKIHRIMTVNPVDYLRS